MKAVGLAALAVVLAAGSAHALDITTKKLQVKMHDDPAKKQFQAFSGDDAVTYEQAVAPGTDGASVHIYSATDDLCYIIPGGVEWTEKAGKSWKYKNKITKNQVQIADGKLQVKLRSGVALNLSNPEGEYNVIVQLGDAGEAFCMTCSGAGVIRDDDQKFQGKECAAAACDAPPSVCNPTVTTTSTTSTTSTTLPALPGVELKAVLNQGDGGFDYALSTGSDAADTQCETTFAGTHACLYSELVAAEAAGDLDNIRDVDDDVVTSFWAIDPTRPHHTQCALDKNAPASEHWTYETGHQNLGGDFVNLTNATGVLSALMPGGVDAGGTANCNSIKWVGCCAD
jgi:hypothetical protein